MPFPGSGQSYSPNPVEALLKCRETGSSRGRRSGLKSFMAKSIDADESHNQGPYTDSSSMAPAPVHPTDKLSSLHARVLAR
ncbi:hypothetical protein Ciccas_003192 [Cichlidogyrus casuarinus]|uniref:Uncharacterized protein n=1 Tax=Cichlidogyrus casuarinus TaxID=1844966 RepID=A0ABD2QF18_9PLAT